MPSNVGWLSEKPDGFCTTKKPWPVTARQLAGNVAGVRHYRDDVEANSTRRFATVTEALDLF